jgi:hypothetical protein
MKGQIILLAVISLYSFSAQAQLREAPERPLGVVKINVFPLVLGNFSIQGEMPIKNRFSGALGFSFLPGMNLSSARAQNEPIMLRGYTITPELRIYAGKQGAPQGFYLAPYLRFARYKTKRRFDSEITRITGGSVTEAELFARYSGAGIGLMLGSQWLIKNRFSIDWWIFGGHVGGGRMDIGIEGYNDLNLSALQLGELEDEIDRAAGLVRFVSFAIPGVNFTRNTAFVTIPLPYTGVRTGVTLGWAF